MWGYVKYLLTYKNTLVFLRVHHLGLKWLCWREKKTETEAPSRERVSGVEMRLIGTKGWIKPGAPWRRFKFRVVDVAINLRSAPITTTTTWVSSVNIGAPTGTWDYVLRTLDEVSNPWKFIGFLLMDSKFNTCNEKRKVSLKKAFYENDISEKCKYKNTKIFSKFSPMSVLSCFLHYRLVTPA